MGCRRTSLRLHGRAPGSNLNDPAGSWISAACFGFLGLPSGGWLGKGHSRGQWEA